MGSKAAIVTPHDEPFVTRLCVEFALRQTVYIDNATDVRVTITAFSWRGSAIQAEAGRYTKRDAEHEAAIEPKNMSAVKADDVPNPPHMVCLTCGAQDVGSGP